MATKNVSKQKKMQTRVDFTPMVDMMMLLITFFMLCTSLSKPQSMELSMPSNDKNMQDEDKSVTKASYTITMYCTSGDKLYYIAGQPKYDDPTCLKPTTWGNNGIRKVLVNHVTEDGTQPILQTVQAKEELDKQRILNPTKYTDDVYNDELKKIRNGEINGEKIKTMTVIIKPTDGATYKNVIDALDEMRICCVGKYVIDKVNPDDEKLLRLANVKE